MLWLVEGGVGVVLVRRTLKIWWRVALMGGGKGLGWDFVGVNEDGGNLLGFGGGIEVVGI